jgi:enolase
MTKVSMKIKSINAEQILDSNGKPTLEVEVVLADGTRAKAGVPAGASTGKTEAVDLRDNDPQKFGGKGVTKAIGNVNTKIASLLVGQEVEDQQRIDQLMIEVDGTDNKSVLGGNAIVGVSMAVARAAARAGKIELYKYFGQLSGNKNFSLPQPLILVLEGGKHGDWATDIQEYFVIPQKELFTSFNQMFEVGKKIFLELEKVLQGKNYDTSFGFEGAYHPKQLKSNEEAIQLIVQAVEQAGFQLPQQFVLGIDAAASEFYTESPEGAYDFAPTKSGKYILKSEGNLALSAQEWLQKLEGWIGKYPIWSVEDGFDQEDWSSWAQFNQKYGDRIQIVGDDLLTTNIKRIQKAIDQKAVNAVLIKINQIGTVTETLEAINLAKSADFATIVSHRGGETMDDFIADLCVGVGCPQCKFGGPTKQERVVKYNRLLKIEEQLV